MNKEEEFLLYKKTMEKFGLSNQLDMLVEECSEVIHAVCKLKRNLPNNLIEELADLDIMLGQFKQEWPLSIRTQKLKKLERLKKLVETK